MEVQACSDPCFYISFVWKLDIIAGKELKKKLDTLDPFVADPPDGLTHLGR